MNVPLMLASCALTTLAAMLLYAASPHQRLGRLPCAPRVVVALGAGLLVTAVAVMLLWAGWAVAICVPLTVLMTVCSIAPLAIGWWHHRRKGWA